MTALEAGAVARAHSEVAELDGRAPASRGPDFGDGRDDGMTAVSDALVSVADRDRAQRPRPVSKGWWQALHPCGVRQRERAHLTRLEAFARENMPPPPTRTQQNQFTHRARPTDGRMSPAELREEERALLARNAALLQGLATR
ncbi:hypothetical protein ACFV0Z_18425 [Streptomyces xiamenensis]|uniref:hypothetical protein n=1 Tax=Streptomyces xiamenensis TaxID=408015 RepID=UPI0036B20A78